MWSIPQNCVNVESCNLNLYLAIAMGKTTEEKETMRIGCKESVMESDETFLETKRFTTN
jgi:hypothetical protein